jgi:pyruvate/2-oxoglutarate/acetoin dehydrogenase E1 component
MTMMSTRDAIRSVLSSELARDRRTVYLGETIRHTGATGASRRLFEQFGPRQVIETPVSENGIFGAALGLALAGYRPIIEIYSADFALAVANEIIGDFAKWQQQQARRQGLPITVRGWMGATEGLGPEHSQCMEAYFHHAPGLTILCPGTPADMAGLLRSAIRLDAPAFVLEHRRLYDLEGEVPDDPDFILDIGRAEVVTEGSDVTIVGWAWMRHLCAEAVGKLRQLGIKAELIDLRTIKPLDFAAVQRSVQKTGRLVVVEEAPVTGNIGAEILARTSEQVSRPVRAVRAAMPDMIHPYSSLMEKEILPDVKLVMSAVESVIAGRSTRALVNRP